MCHPSLCTCIIDNTATLCTCNAYTTSNIVIFQGNTCEINLSNDHKDAGGTPLALGGSDDRYLATGTAE